VADRRAMALEDAKNLLEYENNLTDAELEELIEDLSARLQARRTVRQEMELLAQQEN
jgi:hypothetical protein